ncbi:MAG: hypothetical protein ACK45E_01150, partial [Ignavibacteria bacterium]
MNAIILLLFVAVTCAQADDLGVACREQFETASSAWKTGGSLGRSASIVSGVYRVDQRAAFGDFQAETPCFINYDKDFDIEVRLRQITGSASTGFGLMWSGKNSVNT